MANRHIIANWKQNLTLAEINSWFESFIQLVQNNPLQSGLKVFVAPSFVYLPVVAELVKRFEYLENMSQDVSAFESGSHTGSTGALQIRDYCKTCLVGHSETNTDFDIALKKTVLLLNQSITPYLCFTNFDVLTKSKELFSIPLIWEDPSNISVNGSYRSRDPQEIKAKCIEFKQSNPTSTLLYGGSVNRQNASALGNIVELDGVIVGNASLDPKHFFEIVKAFDL